MPCQAQTFDCRIKGHYISTGNPDYHGELCGGCLWWTDTPADLDFKTRLAATFADRRPGPTLPWSSMTKKYLSGSRKAGEAQY